MFCRCILRYFKAWESSVELWDSKFPLVWSSIEGNLSMFKKTLIINLQKDKQIVRFIDKNALASTGYPSLQLVLQWPWKLPMYSYGAAGLPITLKMPWWVAPACKVFFKETTTTPLVSKPNADDTFILCSAKTFSFTRIMNLWRATV